MREHECVVDKPGCQIPLFLRGTLLDRILHRTLGTKQSTDLLINVIVSSPKAFPAWVHGRPGSGRRHRGADLLTVIVRDLIMCCEAPKGGGEEIVKRTEEQKGTRRR